MHPPGSWVGPIRTWHGGSAVRAHSTQGRTGPADDLAALTAVVGRLAGRDLERLTEAALSEVTLPLARLSDGLDGVWLRYLAAVDAMSGGGVADPTMDDMMAVAGQLEPEARPGPAGRPGAAGPPGRRPGHSFGGSADR